jgi:hypothetical protein
VSGTEAHQSRIGQIADEYDLGVLEVGVRRVTLTASLKAMGPSKSYDYAVVQFDEAIRPELFIEALGIGLRVIAAREGGQ